VLLLRFLQGCCRGASASASPSSSVGGDDG